MNWTSVCEIHDRAAQRLASTADAVPGDRWTVPRADGKWSPAQLVEHLSLVYDVVTREIEGGAGMKIRTKFWMRVFLRATMLGRILRGGFFPAGAPAPPETRPGAVVSDQRTAVAGFRERAARFAAAAANAHDSGRRVRVTHAYFGAAPIERAVLLCARHIEHHQKQLPQ